MEKSKLVLGTAQLGMSYGINNGTGQPDKEESFSILDYAWKHGIDTFDTAPAYGTAEKLLGDWIRSRSLASRARIISKMKGDDAAILLQVCASLHALGIERLDGLLLHAQGDMYRRDVQMVLQNAKRDHMTDHIGVSTYSPTEAGDALGMGFDYIQVPYNVFDRRLDKNDFFERAKRYSVKVFARSPLLQGLLLTSPDRIPPYLAHAQPHVTRFREIASTHGLTPLEAALMYVRAHEGIEYIVFGVETSSQLEQIIAAKMQIIDASCLSEMHETFVGLEESIIDPRLWKKDT